MNILFQSKEDVLSDAYKEEIYNYILNNQNKGREERIKHKNTVAEKKQHQEDLIKQNICPYCGKSLVIRNGKYGKFYGCTGYPKCRFVKKL